MNSKFAERVIAILEPYARKLLTVAEQENAGYRNRWATAIHQAELVIWAYDATENDTIKEPEKGEE